MIYLYNGATSGEKDGTKVSENGNFSNAISVVLNATQNQETVLENICIRCDEGYATVGDVVVGVQGSSAVKWCVSEDNVTYSEWGTGLTLTDPNITDVNRRLYFKVKASSDETAVNDRNVVIRLEATIQSVV